MAVLCNECGGGLPLTSVLVPASLQCPPYSRGTPSTHNFSRILLSYSAPIKHACPIIVWSEIGRFHMHDIWPISAMLRQSHLQCIPVLLPHSFDPCHAESYLKKYTKIYLYFSFTFNIEMVQEVEMLPCGWQGTIFFWAVHTIFADYLVTENDRDISSHGIVLIILICSLINICKY